MYNACRLIKKDLGAGKDWRQEEKGTTEDEMVGWPQRLNGHEFEQVLGDGKEQGSLACYSPWGHKKLDMTKGLNNNTYMCVYRYVCMYISLNPRKAVIFSILFYFVCGNADCASLKWFHDSLWGCSTWQFEKHWPNRKHTDFDVKNKTKEQTKNPWNQISPLSLTTIGTVFCLLFKKKSDLQFPHL